MGSDDVSNIIRLFILGLTEIQRLGLTKTEIEQLFSEARSQSRDIDPETLNRLESECMDELNSLDAAIKERRSLEGGQA